MGSDGMEVMRPERRRADGKLRGCQGKWTAEDPCEVRVILMPPSASLTLPLSPALMVILYCSLSLLVFVVGLATPPGVVPLEALRVAQRCHPLGLLNLLITPPPSYLAGP